MDWVGYRYFTMLMIFGGLFLTNYLLAECCVVFTSHMKNFQLMKDDLAMLNARAGARSPSLRLQNPYEIFFAHCIMFGCFLLYGDSRGRHTSCRCDRRYGG